MNRQLHKNVPFGHKWTISAPGIAFNNARIKDLFSYKVYGGPHKGGYTGLLIVIPDALIVHLCPNGTLFMLLTVQYSTQ